MDWFRKEEKELIKKDDKIIAVAEDGEREIFGEPTHDSRPDQSCVKKEMT